MGLPLFVQEWHGHSVRVLLLNGTSVLGVVRSHSMTPQGVPITLVLEQDGGGYVTVPWSSVAVVA